MQLKLSSPSKLLERSSIKRSNRLRRGRKRWLVTLGLILPLLGWSAYRQIKSTLTPAEAIVVLGGALDREAFAANFAQRHPHLPIWVSSGSNPEYAEWLFLEEAGIPSTRLHLNYDAVDTVTNFTTLIEDLKAQRIEKIYLITSSYHMPRARVIGEIILGSQGIVFEPVAVPSQIPAEPWRKTVRDGVRAMVWLATGYTGADLKNLKKSVSSYP